MYQHYFGELNGKKWIRLFFSLFYNPQNIIRLLPSIIIFAFVCLLKNYTRVSSYCLKWIEIIKINSDKKICNVQHYPHECVLERRIEQGLNTSDSMKTHYIRFSFWHLTFSLLHKVDKVRQYFNRTTDYKFWTWSMSVDA